MVISLERLDDRESRGIVIENEDFSLADPEFTIGRAHDCDLRLTNQFVSRHHCELLVDEREHVVKVRDLGSQNGTFVNEGPVVDDCELKDGDTLVVGCVPFQIHIA